MTNYTLQESDIEAIKKFEGFRGTAYKCPAGVYTIGYGHTKGVRSGQKITKSEAELLLKNDLAKFEKFVNELGVAQTQGMFSSLVDFAYNLGTSALGNSTLLRKIRAGRPTDEILKEFRKWVYAGGKKLNGLVKRREWECQRYVSHD